VVTKRSRNAGCKARGESRERAKDGASCTFGQPPIVCFIPKTISQVRRSILLFSLLVLFLSSTCKREGIGEVLFEIPFPVLEFEVLGGEIPAITRVISLDFVATGLRDAMAAAGVTEEDINVVGGLRARVVSLTGENFSEMERITLRACAVGSTGGCFDPLSQLFTVDDLFGRRQQTVNLNPTPINFKEFFLDNEQVRLELTFQSAVTTSRNLEGRLEWTLAGFSEQ